MPTPSPVRPLSRSVARSATLVATFFAIDKVLGVVRDAVIGGAFGASPALDAYYAAFEVPDALFNVVAGLALATALIPVLSAYTGRGDREGVWHLASVVVNWALIVVTGASILASVFAPRIIATIAPGFDAERARIATQLMRLVLVQTVISSLSGIVMSVLQAHQHFLLPAAAPLAYTLGRIAGALWLAPRLGIFGLAWGGLAGTLGHFLILVPGLIRYRARWRLSLQHPDFVSVLRLMAPRMAGVAVTYLNFVLPTFLGSRLAAGAIASYEYGWRLMQFPETIIGTALGLAVFPTLAQRANALDLDGLRETASWALRLVLALAVPAAVGLIVLGEPLTALFLQRGAFDADVTARVYRGLRAFAVGLVTHSALEVAGRLFYAQRDMWTPLWAAAAGLVANAAAGWVMLQRFEHAGLALANGLGAGVQVLALLWVANRQLGGLATRKLSASVARTALVSALMGATILMTRSLVSDAGVLVHSALGIGAGGFVFVIGTLFVGSEELRELPRLLLRS